MPSHTEEERRKNITRIGAPNAGRRDPVQTNKQIEGDLLKSPLGGGKAGGVRVGSAFLPGFGSDKPGGVSSTLRHPAPTKAEIATATAKRAARKGGIRKTGNGKTGNGKGTLESEQQIRKIRKRKGITERGKFGPEGSQRFEQTLPGGGTRDILVGTKPKKVKPKGGVKRKSLDPFTVKGIGNIGSTFGELAGKFFSPEAQKRRAAAGARAAGVKGRRAESEAVSKRITALSSALGKTTDPDTRSLLEKQLEDLASPTDPQEAIDLKTTLVNR